MQRAFLWSAIEALADSGKMKNGRAVIKNGVSKILLVEEPESFLHPPAIRLAREALYKLAKLENWQVMITTHSPIFIDVSKPHTTITRVEKNDGSATNVFSTDKANFSDDERERLQMIIYLMISLVFHFMMTKQIKRLRRSCMVVMPRT